MSPKQKLCELGEHHVDRLWKAKGKTQKSACKDCWMRYGTNTSEKKNKPSRKPIKPVADKRAKQLALYRIARDYFLKQNPVCQYPGCSSRDVTCHHMKGRVGKLVYDAEHFAALCWEHHKQIEERPELAKKLGLSKNRLDK